MQDARRVVVHGAWERTEGINQSILTTRTKPFVSQSSLATLKIAFKYICSMMVQQLYLQNAKNRLVHVPQKKSDCNI